MTTHRIAVIPAAAHDRPSSALIILHGVLLAHHVTGNGITLSADDVAAICDALGGIVPAVQQLEAATTKYIDIQTGVLPSQAPPSADIVYLRPRQLPPASSDGAA